MSASSPPAQTIFVVLLSLLLGGCESTPPPASPAAAIAESAAAVTATAESPTAAPKRMADAGPGAKATYVTTAVCTQCHADQAKAWAGSHHDMAMRRADESSVRGNFDDQTFTHHDVTWRFQRRGNKYFVSTGSSEDIEGTQPTELEILYTFGVEPLQQYLVAQPNGRMHTLTAAWDSRPADSGGQRWFSLHGDERVGPDDVLHWTGPAQKWNTMCADCHSTDYKKGYDPTDLSYESSWSDINVGCEACHGAGSQHVAWAKKNNGYPDSHPEEAPARGLVRDLSAVRSTWRFTSERGIASSDDQGVRGQELDSCAPCHARRTSAGDPNQAATFLDAYRPALLESGLYYPDGQILDEVYVWGSFLQSKMYAAGVTCSNCHDPHSLNLRAEGNALCAQCHAAQRYEATEHHHHDTDSDGASCQSCHMPEHTYMQNDGRRDHSFRAPRPDLSVKIGVPNACNDCHTDRSADWAAEQVADWPNARQAGLPHFGEAFARARSGAPDAAPQLASIVGNRTFPAIVRATALVELAALDTDRTRVAVDRHLTDKDPLLRYAAARAGASLPPNIRAAILPALTTDPVALVRAEAGRALAGLDYPILTDDQRSNIQAAIATYADGELRRRDEPSSDVNLGLLYLALGDIDAAEAAYREAIAVGPYFLPAYVNLADLYRQTDREGEGEALLLTALQRAPNNAEVHHALGLHRIRSKRIDEALASFERAAKLSPENLRYTYVYAVALDSAGRTEEALRVLQKGLNYSADNPTLLQALITMSVKVGREDDARRYMDRLRAAAPTQAPH